MTRIWYCLDEFFGCGTRGLEGTWFNPTQEALDPSSHLRSRGTQDLGLSENMASQESITSSFSNIFSMKFTIILGIYIYIYISIYLPTYLSIYLSILIPNLGGIFPPYRMFHRFQTHFMWGKGQCFGAETHEDAAAGVEDGEDCEVSCPAKWRYIYWIMYTAHIHCVCI